MAHLENHGQLKWDGKTGKAYYTVAWPIDQKNNTFTGKVTGDISGSYSDEYGAPIQVQGCYATGKSSAQIVAADDELEVTIPDSANGSDAGLYAAITTGYNLPNTDPLPPGSKIQNDRTYYITALQPPSNGSDAGQELKVMPEGAELQITTRTKGCDLCRLVQYTDDEGEVGYKWKSVQNPRKVRYLGTFALVSNEPQPKTKPARKSK